MTSFVFTSFLVVAFLALSQAMPGGVQTVTSSDSSWATIKSEVAALSNAIMYKINSAQGLIGIGCNVKLISAKEQVVEGRNVWAKVGACNSDFAHVYIFIPLPSASSSAPVLKAVQYPKLLADSLDTFKVDNIAVSNSPKRTKRVGGEIAVTAASDAAEWLNLQALLAGLDSAIMSQINSKLGLLGTECQATLIAALEQLVSGTNYWLKIKLCGPNGNGNGAYAHVYAFKPLPYTKQSATVQAIEYPQSQSSKLVAFRRTWIEPNIQYSKQSLLGAAEIVPMTLDDSHRFVNPEWFRIQHILKKASPAIMKAIHAKLGTHLLGTECVAKLVAAMKQIVSGTNYWVKVELCNSDYAHVWMFIDLPRIISHPEIKAIQYPKQLMDELAVFSSDLFLVSTPPSV